MRGILIPAMKKFAVLVLVADSKIQGLAVLKFMECQQQKVCITSQSMYRREAHYSERDTQTRGLLI